MNLVHLTASPFFGGPERQMLGLGLAMRARCRSVYLSFAERGLAWPFLEQLTAHGLEARALESNFPHVPAAIDEVTSQLRRTRADVLFCHGYKADVIGWRAARRVGIPVIAVSRGWTGATWRVHCYEWLDRLCLFAMDGVVCVSQGQARRVSKLGVPRRQVQVIRNSIDIERFKSIDPEARPSLERMFARRPRWIIGAAGRFSPEKGFPVLIEAAARVCQAYPEAGFVLYGEGPERGMMEDRLRQLRLTERILLPGFTGSLDRLLPALDVMVLPSFTEGLPNAALEAAAARVPIVATAVGGTPEIVRDQENGLLVPPGKPVVMADRIGGLLAAPMTRRRMGEWGRRLVEEEFSFAEQARCYENLARKVARNPRQIPAFYASFRGDFLASGSA